MCSSSWVAAAISSSKISANICSSSSSESMSDQAIRGTPVGRVDEERREGAVRWRNIGRGQDIRRNIDCWVEERRSSGNWPADWRGMVPAATEQREGREDLGRQSGGIRVFCRRHSGSIPAFLSSGVPERTPGVGDGLDSPDGLKAIRRKTRSRGAAGLDNAVRMLKGLANGSSGRWLVGCRLQLPSSSRKVSSRMYYTLLLPWIIILCIYIQPIVCSQTTGYPMQQLFI
jgi:hypothetical protein